VITNVLPKASFTSNIDTVMINKGGMVKFTNTSTDASTLTWDFGDSSQTSSMEHPTHQYINPGTYIVTLIASNGNCIQQFQKTIVVIMGTGLENNLIKQVSVSPNPSSDFINIKYGKNHLMNVVVFDAIGKSVLFSNENKIMIKDLPNGYYMLRIFFEEGVVDKKIIKKN